MKELILALLLISCGSDKSKADTIPLPPVIIPSGNCGISLHTLQASWSFNGVATGYNFYVGNEIVHTFIGGNIFTGSFDYKMDVCSSVKFTMTAVNGSWESPHSAEYCAGLGCDGQYGIVDVL